MNEEISSEFQAYQFKGILGFLSIVLGLLICLLIFIMVLYREDYDMTQQMIATYVGFAAPIASGAFGIAGGYVVGSRKK